MSYRLSTQVRPLIWIEAVVEPHSGSRIEYMIKAKSQFKQRSVANNVEIHIPVPPDADSPSFKAQNGTAKYAPEKDCIVWTIKQFPGQKEHILRAHFGLPSVQQDGQLPKKPISVKFEIPYFTVSGIQVKTSARAQTSARAPVRVRVHTHAHRHKNTHTHARAHTRTRTDTNARTHAHRGTWTVAKGGAMHVDWST